MAYAYQPGGPGGGYSSPVFNYSSVAGGFQGMLKAFQDLTNQANQVNEQRYRDILGGYRYLGTSQEASLANIEAANAGIFSRMYEDFSQMGVQQKKDITQQFANTSAKARQDMIGSGLGASTILPNVMGGISRQEADAQGRLEDTLAQQRFQAAGREAEINQSLGALRVNTTNQNAGNTLSFMERRNDVQPDLSMLASLASAYGAGGGGGGGANQYASAHISPPSQSIYSYLSAPFQGGSTRAAQRIAGGYAGFIG